jgi:hypothetical protein
MCHGLLPCSAYRSADSDEFNAAFKFGRAVSILGVIFGWPMWAGLVTLLFARVPGQQNVLRVISIGCFVMAASSMLLFTGLDSAFCDSGTCKPRAVLAVIPSFAFFIATGALILWYQKTDRIPSRVKPSL